MRWLSLEKGKFDEQFLRAFPGMMPLTSASCLIMAGQGGWEGRRDNELLGTLGEHSFDAGIKEQSFHL